MSSSVASSSVESSGKPSVKNVRLPWTHSTPLNDDKDATDVNATDEDARDEDARDEDATDEDATDEDATDEDSTDEDVYQYSSIGRLSEKTYGIVW